MIRVDREHGGVRVALGDAKRGEAQRRRRPAPRGLDDEVLAIEVGQLLADTLHLRPFGHDVYVLRQAADPLEGRLQQREACGKSEQVLRRLLARAWPEPRAAATRQDDDMATHNAARRSQRRQYSTVSPRLRSSETCGL